jgi:hypothetical protein
MRFHCGCGEFVNDAFHIDGAALALLDSAPSQQFQGGFIR